MEASAADLLPYGIDPMIYTSNNYVVLDFETTNIAKGDCRRGENAIVLACWLVVKDGEVTRKEKIGNEYELGELATDIEAADFFVAHNTKFEYGWLKRMGVEIDEQLAFCTMIGEYVILGNRREGISLDAIAGRRIRKQKLSLVSILIKGGVCPSQIPTKWLLKYCHQDIDLCHEVFLLQRQEMLDLNLMPVMFTRCIATPILVGIEAVGMHLDHDRVQEENIAYEAELSVVSRKVSEFTGSVNLNSPLQVAELLYDRLGFNEPKDKRGRPIRTGAGRRRADAATISSFKGRNKSQREFLELFKERGRLNAALTKNLRFFRGIVEERDGIFYANYNQTVTKTHRLSSSGVKVPLKVFDGDEKGIQLQNSPRIFKRLYSARKEGWKIGERDGSQLEFRVAAELGEDAVARSDIERGVDVHQFTADTLTDAGEPTSRQEAKSRTFKPLYGGGSGTDAEREYFAAFKEKYHGVADAQNRWIDSVLKTKKLTTITGLIFYWPDTRETQSGYVTNTTAICNFPVQSFATADIIPIALVLNHYLLKREQLESFVVNTIHDSIISEVKPEEEDEYNAIGKWAFTTGVLEYLKSVYDIEFKVPMDSDSKTTRYWGEGE